MTMPASTVGCYWHTRAIRSALAQSPIIGAECRPVTISTRGRILEVVTELSAVPDRARP
jgi:hypothetical protein